MSVVDIAKIMVPPQGETYETTRWRWIMFVTVIAIIGAGLLHQADLLPGHDKYATSEQMAAIVQQSSRFEQRYLKNQIRELSILYCQALRDNETSLKIVYRKDLDDMLIEFKTLTGTEYPLRSCSET